jgi:pilus assembly protein CpaC
LFTWFAVGLTAHGQPPEQLPMPMADQLALPPNTAGNVDQQLEGELIDEVIEPDLRFRIDPVRSLLVRTKQKVSRISIADPVVLDVTQYGPTEFEFFGKRSGETALSMWFIDESGQEQVLRYLVHVGTDQEEQTRADLEYGELQDRLNEMFPNSQIQLIPIADKLIIRGQARDAEEVTQILSIVRAGGDGDGGGGWGGGWGGGGGVAAGPVATLPDAPDLPVANVINLLEVPGEHQVMLKVRIAELTRSAIRELGVEFNVGDGAGDVSNWNFSVSPGNLSAILNNTIDLDLYLKAFSGNGYGKILAEPTLVTISGRAATFLAGGEFAVPTAVGIGGIGAATTSFRGFGTMLTFTPTVLDKDRIRMHVMPSFSTINADLAVDGIPGLNSRAVSTTVDLREGQWLAIAGLIEDQQGGSKARIPFLGDIPFFGAPFMHESVRREETELVVLVSPELVHPMDCKQVPLILPGMDVTEPNDKAFFCLQQIEGHPDVQHRSTVWPAYRDRLREAGFQAVHAKRGQPSLYYQQQRYYMCGPQGFSE